MIRYRAFLFIAIVGLWACGSAENKGTAGDSSRTPGTASARVSTTATPSHSAASSHAGLTFEQLELAYQAELFDVEKMRDPFEKKAAAVRAKLGPPQTAEVGGLSWYGWRAPDGAIEEACFVLRMDRSGSSSLETTAKENCRSTVSN